MTGVSDAGRLLRHAAYLLERPDGIGHDVVVSVETQTGVPEDRITYQFLGPDAQAVARVDELAAVLALPRADLTYYDDDPTVMHYGSSALRGHEHVSVIAVIHRPAEVGAHE